METPKIEKRTIISATIAIIIVALIAYGLWSTRFSGPSNENTSGKKEVKIVKTIAGKGDIVAINFTGNLANGTVFDSNIDPKFQHVRPHEFTLGVGQVIAGWDEGIIGMKKGEKKTLTVPPEKAYGARGQGPIPPNSTLTFEIELLSIK